MFSGVTTLIKLILRRDRFKLPVWMISIIGLLVAMVPMLGDMYGDLEGLDVLYSSFGTNPAGLFITGPMDLPTFGGLMTIESLIWWGIAIALLNTFLIIRHTRLNEETESQEIILSAPVSRSASLIAAVLVSLVVNILIAIGIGIFFSLFTEYWSTGQAWLYGIAFGVFGLLWASIAAVVAQLVESTRTANGILGSLLGLSFVVRGVGDFLGTIQFNGSVNPHWISYFSPIGWLQQVRPLTFPDWWPVAIMFVVSLGLLALSYKLVTTRDVGSGVLPARSGKVRASRLLRTLEGLVWYLHRNIFISYLVGSLLMVGIVGALVTEVSGVYESSEDMRAVIVAMGGSGDMTTAFLSAMLVITVLIIVGYAVNALEKMKGEEVSGRLENVLATSASKIKWLSLNIVFVIVAVAFMLAVSGGVMALVVNLVSDLGVSVLDYVSAGLSYLPLVLVVVGGYVFLYSLLPRVVSVFAWTYFGFMLFVAWIGPMLGLRKWVTSLSLFEHVPSTPVESIDYGVIGVMTTIGLCLILAGLVIWRRRDLV